MLKKFGPVSAVDHISLQVFTGEFFSLLGPSGCGKTTTLRMLAGFEMPDAGQIIIDGVDQTLTPPYRRPVNMVFQQYALFPHMNVYQNVAFGLDMLRLPAAEKHKRVIEVLELVQLPKLENRRPNQLSGGQQQRVALARALVRQPKVLLLDEPLGALDLKLRKAMQIELKALQHRLGISFVYVTHDQEEALTMSDRIAVMDHGVVLQIGTPVEIYEKPIDRFVADFIGETNLLAARVEKVGEPAEVRIGREIFLPVDQIQAELGVGAQAVLSIRPEKIHITVNGSRKNNSAVHLPGKIEKVLYLGTDTRYEVQIEDDLHLVVRLQNMDGTETRFQLGDQVIVSWDTRYARVLKE